MAVPGLEPAIGPFSIEGFHERDGVGSMVEVAIQTVAHLVKGTTGVINAPAALICRTSNMTSGQVPADKGRSGK